MKRYLFPSSNKVRDAGEIAFGILIFGILIFVFSLIGGAIISAFFPEEQRRTTTLIGTCFFWAGGMIPVLIHYKKAAREWPEEQRGENMLMLVEFLSAATKLFIDNIPHEPNDDALYALKLYLSGFVLLLAGSHMLTYLLLWYKPKMKEVTLWLGIAIVFLLENSHS